MKRLKRCRKQTLSRASNRADSSRARAAGGSGIGLSTAKAIVPRHHGCITNDYRQGVISFAVSLPQGSPK